MKHRRPLAALSFFAVVVAGAASGGLFAQAPADQAAPAAVPLSKIAPVKDLMAQKDYFMGRLSDDVSDKGAYSDAMQDRLLRDASVMSVILQGFGMHDTDNPLKAAAPALRAQVAALIEKRGDFDAAKAEFDKLDEGVKNPKAGEGAVSWDQHAELGQLMKQVSTYNTRLRRGTSEAQFNDRLKDTEEASAIIALVGQSILSDTHMVENKADTAKWYEYAVKLRDLAGEINAAVAAKDQARAAAAYGKLYPDNCNACHESFRKEEDE